MDEYLIIGEIFRKDTDRKLFKKYIEYIRFPYFKNYSKDLRIDFDYPITFITGTNGTGKSSLLHALYGSVEGKSISDFWFNTALESIEDIKDNRHCFIYGFRTEVSNKEVEAIKTRILKMKGKNGYIDSDYWEPSRPLKRYGMESVPLDALSEEANQTRWKLLKKDVIYMDFRYSLSAFDKYFYFGTKPDTITMKSKQDLIRKRSNIIKKAYDTNNEQKFHSRIVTKPIDVDKKALNEINKILGKEYNKATMLKHNLYDGQEGFSIKYVTNNINYTEAYAGSGEIAVVKLVNDIIGLRENSLILLDEPETSLHPDAQKKFIEFINKQIVEKKHQVVISTHSPDILEGAPESAIKVLYESKNDCKINLIKDVDYQSAFHYIGHTINDKKTIIVEDKLAKEILQTVIDDLKYSSFFEIIYNPGGESVIKKEDIVVYSKNNTKNHFIVFDGDQRFDKINIRDLSENQKNQKDLNEIIHNLVKQNITFCTDGGKGELSKAKQNAQKIDAMLKYLDFIQEKVYFLPCGIPEEIIWDEETALKQTEGKHIKWSDDSDNYKSKIANLSKIMFDSNDSSMITATQKFLITIWKNKKNSSYYQVEDIVKQIKRTH